MSKDWYRRHTWTESDQAEFFARLGRSRTSRNKAQYARIQAWELHHADGPRHALEALRLLDMIVESWMETAQRALVHQQRAECLRSLDRNVEAIEAYREVFTEQRRLPSDLTNAHFDYAWWIAVSGRSELFDEALDMLEEFSRQDGITFPFSVYLAEGARALIAHARGDRQVASTHARRALEAAEVDHSGLRDNPVAGLVRGRDGPELERLAAIAADE